jgi:hypothetical protein
MHLTGHASHAVSGLGSQGKMYATALKLWRNNSVHPAQ